MNDRSCFHYIHDGQTTRWGPRHNMLLLPRFGTHKPLECGVWSCLKDLQPSSPTDRTIKHDLIKPTLSPHVGFLFDLMFLKALLREGHLPLADERRWCVAKKSQRLPLAYKKAQHEGFRRCCLNAVPGWAYCFKKTQSSKIYPHHYAELQTEGSLDSALDGKLCAPFLQPGKLCTPWITQNSWQLSNIL